MSEQFFIDDKNKFIEKNIDFIHKTSSFICKKRLDKSNDEEFSIAMEAFNKAWDSFSEERGNFFSYAKTVIRNSLIDYFRNSKNIPVLYFEEDEGAREIDNTISLDKYDREMEHRSRLEEINSYKEKLEEYKIDFFDLTKSSPSHRDTREDILNLALLCVRDEEIMRSLYDSKKLPIVRMIEVTGRNRKFIEKWRKYIISLIILLSSKDYIYLKSYLNIRRKE
ncbi:sigma factor [Clostridium manihotivorum]|uniref:RNA polymerase sigma factor SigI n=1 Tax=Clostridium manihotivorum TaxID=2320868 RepID=A0A410DNT2_9CLOT|nr:sigma factor [Clostridium manihotivorum]QAA30706.1 RNA polymerase subunit sigma [Clostridium manihotivorum]